MRIWKKTKKLEHDARMLNLDDLEKRHYIYVRSSTKNKTCHLFSRNEPESLAPDIEILEIVLATAEGKVVVSANI